MSDPPGPVTVMAPEVAPAGTVTVRLLLPTAVTAAGEPLKATTGDAPKLNPDTTTEVPGGPSVGLNVVRTVGLFGPLPVSTKFLR